MAWRDNLRDGSFRGVAFKIVSHEAEGGRRGEAHEYPERDTPWFEDLGRKRRGWSVEAVVLGAEYMAARDALIEACERKGTGTLVHPFLGEIEVQCTEHRFRESTAEGGAAFFSLVFVEPGEPTSTNQKLDTTTRSIDIADRVQAETPARFADQFSVAGMPSFVEDAAANQVRSIADLAADAGSNLGGAGAALRAYETGLASLPTGALSLVRSPLSLGHAIVGLAMAVAGLSASPLARIRALRSLIGATRTFPPVLGSTVARVRQRDNQLALQRLVVAAAAAEAVRAAAVATFASYDEAVALRDALSDDIDMAVIEAADAGDDCTTAVLEELRLAMIRDVTARGGSLERLYFYEPPQTQPALVIAHDLYGDAELVIDRAEELVERNAIPHPGFVPGGRTLSVRTLSEGAIDG